MLIFLYNSFRFRIVQIRRFQQYKFYTLLYSFVYLHNFSSIQFCVLSRLAAFVHQLTIQYTIPIMSKDTLTQVNFGINISIIFISLILFISITRLSFIDYTLGFLVSLFICMSLKVSQLDSQSNSHVNFRFRPSNLMFILCYNLD